jgi:hypothetical protein
MSQYHLLSQLLGEELSKLLLGDSELNKIESTEKTLVEAIKGECNKIYTVNFKEIKTQLTSWGSISLNKATLYTK